MKVVNELFFGWSWILAKHREIGFVTGGGVTVFNIWGVAINFRISTTNRSPIYLLPAFYLTLATFRTDKAATTTRGLGVHLLTFDLSFNLFKNEP